MKDRILENLKNTAGLESLYRENSQAFEKDFDAVFLEYPNSQILKVWNERIHFEISKKEVGTQTPPLAVVILIALVVGVFAKLPAFFSSIDASWYYERNTPIFILAGIAAYFLAKKKATLKQAFIPVILFAGTVLYANLLPSPGSSDTLMLALLHMPFFLWSVVGLAYILPKYKSLTTRVDYLKYNGEMLIYTGILAITGGILTGLTLGLFSVTGIDIRDWYVEWIVVFGAVACPIIATYISEIRESYQSRIAPLVARIFSPLLLITLVTYLVMVILGGKNPFIDREFLISFNAMLLGVLAICIFVLTEQSSKLGAGKLSKLTSAITVALLAISLMIDGVALAAMLFRLASYGLTPNRVVVLGMNILVFVHILGILYHYVGHLLKNKPLSKTTEWIGFYLPVYTLWTAFVVFAYPVLNAFR